MAMAWVVEGTDQFAKWYLSLNDQDTEAVDFVVGLLEERGPTLKRPYADTIRESAYANMKELRAQSGGDPLRIFFAFDPRRTAILLIGADKTGESDARFYGRMVPIADALYAEHLSDLGTEDRGNN
jgi:hypothetical protein